MWCLLMIYLARNVHTCCKCLIICRDVRLGLFHVQFSIFVCHKKKGYRELVIQIGQIRKVCIALVLLFELFHLNNICSATTNCIL